MESDKGEKQQRAVIEYKEFPVTGKPRVMNRVIEDAVDDAAIYKEVLGHTSMACDD